METGTFQGIPYHAMAMPHIPSIPVLPSGNIPIHVWLGWFGGWVHHASVAGLLMPCLLPILPHILFHLSFTYILSCGFRWMMMGGRRSDLLRAFYLYLLAPSRVIRPTHILCAHRRRTRAPRAPRALQHARCAAPLLTCQARYFTYPFLLYIFCATLHIAGLLTQHTYSHTFYAQPARCIRTLYRRRAQHHVLPGSCCAHYFARAASPAQRWVRRAPRALRAAPWFSAAQNRCGGTARAYGSAFVASVAICAFSHCLTWDGLVPSHAVYILYLPSGATPPLLLLLCCADFACVYHMAALLAPLLFAARLGCAAHACLAAHTAFALIRFFFITLVLCTPVRIIAYYTHAFLSPARTLPPCHFCAHLPIHTVPAPYAHLLLPHTPRYACLREEGFYAHLYTRTHTYYPALRTIIWFCTCLCPHTHTYVGPVTRMPATHARATTLLYTACYCPLFCSHYPYNACLAGTGSRYLAAYSPPFFIFSSLLYCMSHAYVLLWLVDLFPRSLFFFATFLLPHQRVPSRTTPLPATRFCVRSRAGACGVAAM